MIATFIGGGNQETSGKPKLILSAATAAGKEKIDTAYDFAAMVKYVFLR
jgi:hypothetical protein